MATIIRERFSKPADEFMARFVASIDADRNLVEHDIRGSIAHAKMLRKQRLITAREAGSIIKGLERIARDWKAGRFTLDVALEDVHMNVEKRLTDLTKAGAKLHTARSRNDQVALDLKLWVNDAALFQIAPAIAKLIAALLVRAGEHAGTVFPGTTHLQHAQPVVFGHVLLAYADRLGRDSGRFAWVAACAETSPLGACALAGTSLPIDPSLTARELRCGTFKNSIDAVSDRDTAAELVFACALLMTHLSQMAEDLVLWSTPEFGFIELPDELCTSSSIMPQKKNPDMIELVRGKAGGVIGNLVNLLVTLKGLPNGYNRDLQETKPPVFDAAQTARLSLQAMTLAIRGMKVRKDAMRRAASDPQMLATDLAEYLVRKGVPFRESHGILARLMKDCAARGTSPAEMNLADLRQYSRAFGSDVYGLLTPEASVRGKRSPGGTAPALVEKRVRELAKGKK